MIPSVTTIISPWIDTEWFTDESRDRGTAVHAAASCHVMGLWFPPLDPEHQPYFDSFRKWSNQMIDTVVLVEARLHDKKLGFNGRPDIVAILKGDTEPSNIDIKTGQAYQAWWALQDAAYRHLEKVDKSIIAHRGLSLRTKKDGSGCLINEHPKDYRPAFNIFLSAMNIYKFFNRGGK